MDWILKQFENGSFQDEILVTLIATFVVLMAGRIVGLFLWIWRRITGFFGARRRLRRLYREITRTRIKGRWSRPVSAIDRNLQRKIGDSIPVLLVANQKGGVGKTTLAANLGAYFALKRKMRVLFVDLDFQGTLSAPLLAMANQQNQESESQPRLRDILLADFKRRRRSEMSTAQTLMGLIRQCPPVKLAVPQHDGNLGFSGFIDAGSGIGDLEDWLMMKWVARLDRADVRFQFARFLHSAEVQAAYDVVILDAPPRNTTAGVNGLCAATHILVPSRADRFSWSGARRYLEEATVEHALLAPHAKFCGFVGTMMTGAALDNNESPFLRSEIDALSSAQIKDPGTGVTKPLASYWPAGSGFRYLGNATASVAFTDAAGVTIPYLVSKPVRDMIEPIGDRLIVDMTASQHEEVA